MNKMLLPYDIVGGSFWLISVAMIGATLFFFFERSKVSVRWHTPMTMIAVVCLMSSIHYFFVKNLWVVSGTAPTLLRYIDWFLTVPLQIIEFYLILSVASKIPREIFYKLLGASIIMLVAGFLGETGMISRMLGFTIGTFAWLYIIYEIFFGETAQYKNETTDKSVIFAFDALKYIITIGWAIYPIGYLLKEKNLNLVYNIGDLVNKILFALIIWFAGKKLSVKG